MITFVSFIAALAILITFHEFGHFSVAKWCGVKVLKFSLGFGSPIYSKKVGLDSTEFVISAIPLGGYVKMLDERELTPHELLKISESDRLRSFNRQNLWKRVAIVSAGPLANFLLAILIFWILIGQGTIGLKPVVGNVAPNSNAEKASINKGDTIVSIDNQKINTWQDLSWELIKKNGQDKPVELTSLDLNGELKKHHLSFSHPDKNNFESDLLLQLGLSPNLPIAAPIIGEVLDNSVGFLAGLKAGDLILRVNDKKIENWAQFVLIIKESPNESLSVDLDRAGDQLSVILKPDVYIDNNHAVGRIGVTYKPNKEDLDPYLVKLNHSFIKSLGMASKKTWDISIYSLKMIGKMALGQASLKAIGGPVTIATYSGKTAQLGILPWLGFLAMLSISLGVMNLLPIPVLDGGHLLYYMVEAIKGSPVSEYAMQLGQKVGFILLGLLMICAFYNDITRLITG